MFCFSAFLCSLSLTLDNFPYSFHAVFIFTCDWNSQTSALLVLDVFGIRCACSVKNISFRFTLYTRVIFRNPAFAAKINSSLDVTHRHHFCAISHVTLLLFRLISRSCALPKRSQMIVSGVANTSFSPFGTTSVPKWGQLFQKTKQKPKMAQFFFLRFVSEKFLSA